MLKKEQGRANAHFKAARESLASLGRRPLATLITCIVIGLILTLPALFRIGTANLQKLTESWQDEGYFSLYLAPASLQQQKIILGEAKRVTGVGKASLKTPDQILSELQAQEGMQDIIKYLPENPLPAVIEIIPEKTRSTPMHMQALYQNLKALSGIEQIRMDMQWVKRLHALGNFISTVGNILSLLLGISVILIIGNVLRMAIHQHQEEIQVLKLIGAPDNWIARPFLYSGVWYGLGGALLALVLVSLFTWNVALATHQLAATWQMPYSLSGLSMAQTCFLILVAIFSGWAGAFLSVKRQLFLIEPCQG